MSRALLRRLLLHSTSSSASSIKIYNLPSSLLSRPPLSDLHPLPFFPSPRTFSSSPDLAPIIQLADEICKDVVYEPIPLIKRLDRHFSHITPTPSLILHVLNHSIHAGRDALIFDKWLSSRHNFVHTDETLSYLIEYFGRRKDFKIIDKILAENRTISGPKTLSAALDRMVRAGRSGQVVQFFEKMDKEYGFVRDRNSLEIAVSALCGHGYAGMAERLVNSVAHEIFPNDKICDLLIRGWCVDGKLDEAKRLAGEIYRGGFELGTVAYNSILDCVCKLCRKKEPFQLKNEAEKVLIDMDFAGVPRNVETFNVLITNLCKLRMTEDAVQVFEKMGEWGCSPDATTFLVLTKSLYQAARVGEGDEMIDRMKSAGFGSALDKKAYFEFLTILCGIERVEHAMKIFMKMKNDGCTPGVRTYDLLMGKLCAHGQAERANALFKEATYNGVPVVPKVYKLDPRFAKKPKSKKSEGPKRETLPEKMARKRRRLKKIRLSYVKKPKKGMRRSY